MLSHALCTKLTDLKAINIPKYL